MTKYLILTLTIILASSRISAQLSPDNYVLLDDKNALSKINFQNPLSNTITDIITIGDTVWLGTSRGVSLSIDGGANWTNFTARQILELIIFHPSVITMEFFGVLQQDLQK